ALKRSGASQNREQNPRTSPPDRIHILICLSEIEERRSASAGRQHLSSLPQCHGGVVRPLKAGGAVRWRNHPFSPSGGRRRDVRGRQKADAGRGGVRGPYPPPRGPPGGRPAW